MLKKRFTNKWYHRNIEVRRGNAAELLQRLKLKYDGDKLKRRIDRTGGTYVRLTRIESLAKKLVERNAQAVMRTDGITVEVVYVDFIVIMVMPRLLGNQMIKSVPLHDIASRFVDAAAERKLVNIGVLVLNIRRR